VDPRAGLGGCAPATIRTEFMPNIFIPFSLIAMQGIRAGRARSAASLEMCHTCADVPRHMYDLKGT
jgi:hypothetical protein